MKTSEIIAVISATSAAIGLIISVISIFIAGKAYNTNKKMFKRQGIIDLYMAWFGTNNINLDNPVVPDIIKSANVLDLTASLWNHDVVEKIILYQSYWLSFKNIYEKLNSSDKKIPGMNKKFKDLITKEVVKAYEDMKQFELHTVVQTKL